MSDPTNAPNTPPAGTPVYAFGDGKILKAVVRGAVDTAVASNPMLAVAKAAVEAAVKEAAPAIKVAIPGVAGATPIDLAPEVVEQIAASAVTKMQKTPEVQYGTGGDEWYQSRAVWSTITGIATPVLALLGYTLAPEVRDCVATIGIAFGPAVAGSIMVVGSGLSALFAWRERKASKPLGTTATDPAKMT